MMKNSIKILILAGILTGSYDCAMDNQMSKSLNLGQSDIQAQEQVSGQEVLEQVKEILSSLRKEARNVNDPEVAKKIVARYLDQVANATQTNLLELQLIADQAIDIAAQDIDEQNKGLVIIQGTGEQGEAGFNKAFRLIAQGLNKAIITTLGVAGGVVVGAGIAGIGIPVDVIQNAYHATFNEPAPFGEFKVGDSFATKAVKLLPNILSRALAGVVSATATAAIDAIIIPKILLHYGLYGGHIANPKFDQNGKALNMLDKIHKNIVDAFNKTDKPKKDVSSRSDTNTVEGKPANSLIRSLSAPNILNTTVRQGQANIPEYRQVPRNGNHPEFFNISTYRPSSGSDVGIGKTSKQSSQRSIY